MSLKFRSLCAIVLTLCAILANAPASRGEGNGGGGDGGDGENEDEEALMTGACNRAGRIAWSVADNKLEWCDGAIWHDSSSGGPKTRCSGSKPGTIFYDGSDLLYCDGTNWIRMRGNTVGSCSGSTAGTFIFDTVAKYYKFCDGNNWRKMESGGGT